MSTALVHVPKPTEEAFVLTTAQKRLRQLVLNSVQSDHSKRNYAKALDDLFAFSASQPLSRALLMEYRTTMDHLSPSTNCAPRDCRSGKHPAGHDPCG